MPRPYRYGDGTTECTESKHTECPGKIEKPALEIHYPLGGNPLGGSGFLPAVTYPCFCFCHVEAVAHKLDKADEEVRG